MASGSGTQRYTSWNALQNGEDLDDFFVEIYKRSRFRSRRERTTVEVNTDPPDATDPHDYIRSLPGAGELPLWRIGCRVCLWLNKLKKII